MNEKKEVWATTISKKPYTKKSELHESSIMVANISANDRGVGTDLALHVIFYSIKKSQLIYMNKKAARQLRDQLNELLED